MLFLSWFKGIKTPVCIWTKPDTWKEVDQEKKVYFGLFQAKMTQMML